MKFAIFLLPQAETDIDSHCAFLAKTSIEKSLDFDQAAFNSFELLSEMPLIGSERSFKNPKLVDIRIWLVKDFEKYIIFYRAFGNYIEIVRVLHSAQDTNFILEEDSIN
jgi:toxin ParE1/3/4